MTRRWNWNIQLNDRLTGAPIIAAGGVVYVSKNGLPAKETLVDKDGVALSNPLALTRGKMDFWVESPTNDMVDLFIACPGGQFLVVKDVPFSGRNEYMVDTQELEHTMVIPFEQDDFTAAVETDTGFDEPTNAVFQPDGAPVGIRVVDIDATETLDVGTATAETGDPNGLIAAAALGVQGIILGDQGSLLTTLVGHISAGKSIVITSTAGSDTGSGFIYLPYRLLN